MYFIRVSWSLDAAHELDDRELSNDLEPFLVPPTLEKNPYFQNVTMSDVWRTARRRLASADRLFVIGYSLPDADLMMRSLLARPSGTARVPAYIVDVDVTKGDVLGRYTAALKRFYMFSDDYIGLDAVPRFIDDYCSGKVRPVDG